MSIDKIKASRAIRKAKPLGRYALGGEPEPPMVPGGATANLDLPKEDRVTAAMREGWGEGDLGLSEESRRWLIEHGVYPSSAKDPSLLKRINRGVIESIEPVGEAALRGSNAMLHGVANVAGGYYDKLPLPSFIRNNLGTGAQLERDLVDMPNAFMASVPGGYINAVNTTKAARGLERAGLRAGERGGVNLGPKASKSDLPMDEASRMARADKGSGKAMSEGDDYIYHTSPEKIGAIHDRGMFGDVLHFSTKPYTMSAAENPTTYKMKYSDDDFIDASSLYHHDDAAKIQPIANRLAKRYGITSDAAEDIISGNKSSYDFGLDSETSAQLGWDAQTAAAKAAKKLGYKGAKGQDEQGAVYMVPMRGREKDLIPNNSSEGIGLSKAGLGPKGDVLGMGVGKKLEPFGKEFNQLITEGTDQEYSGVAKLIEDWNYNGNKNALSKLEKHPEYASYKQTIDQILSAAYPDGKIPVYRKKGLHGTGKEGKFVSTSILPDYGSKKGGNDFFINTKDVHAIGNLEEGEFIVKPVALQPTSEPPTPGAVHQRALGAKLFGLK